MRRIGSIVLLIMFFLWGAAQTEAVEYELIILNPVSGWTESLALAINNQGGVVGRTKLDNSTKAVYWGPGNQYLPKAIPTFGGDRGVANGINDGNYVVGEATDASGNTRAFLWDPTTEQLRPLAGLSGSTIDSAFAINIHGKIAGYSFSLTDFSRACLFGLNVAAVDISHDKQGSGNGINDAGQVIGTSQPEGFTGPRQAFLWTNGALKYLYPDSPGSVGLAINNSGQATGSVRIPYEEETIERAFIWDSWQGSRIIPTVPIDQGQNWGLGINKLGHVVGYSGSTLDSSNRVAFLWVGGPTSVDLNTLIPNNSFRFLEAFDINDKGEIVGLGRTADSQERGFLLRPKNSQAGSIPPIVNILTLDLE